MGAVVGLVMTPWDVHEKHGVIVATPFCCEEPDCDDRPTLLMACEQHKSTWLFCPEHCDEAEAIEVDEGHTYAIYALEKMALRVDQDRR